MVYVLQRKGNIRNSFFIGHGSHCSGNPRGIYFIEMGFTRFPPANRLELESLGKEKEEEMISLVIGLFIGAFIGFFLAAIIARGKSAESSTPHPHPPLTKVNHP